MQRSQLHEPPGDPSLIDWPSVRSDLSTLSSQLFSLLVAAVVRSAQRLPVAPAPEQRLITPMGNLVVNHRGRRHSALCLAHHAQRMLTQETLSRLLPPVAVAALGCCLATSAPTPGLHRGYASGVQHGQ